MAKRRLGVMVSSLTPSTFPNTVSIKDVWVGLDNYSDQALPLGLEPDCSVGLRQIQNHVKIVADFHVIVLYSRLT